MVSNDLPQLHNIVLNLSESRGLGVVVFVDTFYPQLPVKPKTHMVLQHMEFRCYAHQWEGCSHEARQGSNVKFLKFKEKIKIV